MKKHLPVIIAIIVAVGLTLALTFALLPQKQPEEQLGRSTITNDINFFASGATTTPLGDMATTTSATSTNTGNVSNVQSAKKITFYFQRTGIYGNDGTSTFHVEVSNKASTTDDNNWVIYNRLLDNVENSNAQDLTRVAEVALTGTTTKIYSMDLSSEIIKYVRCIVEEATDGEHICIGKVQY